MSTTGWRNRDIKLWNCRRAAEPEADGLLKVVDCPKEQTSAVGYVVLALIGASGPGMISEDMRKMVR